MEQADLAPKKKRRLLRWGGVFLLIAMGFLGGTAARLSQAPVALPDWVLTRIEARVNRDLTQMQTALGSVALGYDTEAHALRLVLRDVAVMRDGVEVATVPVARLGLDGPEALRGRFRPRSLALRDMALDARRSAQGSWSLAFGDGTGALPSTWGEALALLDFGLDVPILAELEAVQLHALTLAVEDAVTGLQQTIRADGGLAVTPDGAMIDLRAQFVELGVGLQAGLVRDATGARAELRSERLRFGRLAAALPEVPALALVTGAVEGEARFAIDPDGVPGPLEGRLHLRDVRSTDIPRLNADRAQLAVEWQPGEPVLQITELTASSDDTSLKAHGQVIFEDGITGPIQLQTRLTDLRVHPDDFLEKPAQFSDGVFEARLQQRPLTLQIGQAMLTGATGRVFADGQISFPPDGMAGGINLRIPQMDIEDMRPLWPKGVAPGARDWFMRNLLDGQARDVTAALRLSPGQALRMAASMSFRDGAFRYMRTLPPATSANGVIEFIDGRASLRADAARVEIGEGRGIDISGTRVVLPDALSQPPEGQISLRARGGIGDVLELLDHPPFRLLERIRKSRDLASGQADATVEIALPLRPGNAPADVKWSVEGTLRDVVSAELVPERRIEAVTLDLRADANLVEIGGALRFDGVPFDGVWRQVLPPPLTEPVDPDNPPPPRPLPEPGRVQGTASATPEGLARLGVNLDALSLSGRTDVALDITLPQGLPPRLVARSDLRGMGARLPAIGWSKGPGSSAALTVEATLGPSPQVTRLALDAPGLEAEGRIALEAGRLSEARFDRVRTPWFRGPVTLTGRGAGRSPRVSVGGGQADLRAALGALSGGSSSARGDSAPVTIALERLTVSETITLTGLRAELQGGSGRFQGGVNGGQSVSGVLAPRNGGTVVQIATDDAGGVLRATGLFKDARGGEMTLTLQSPAGGGALQGALRGSDLVVRDAPAIASLLQTLSVVGLLEQLSGQGLPFTSVSADFTLSDGNIALRRASAVGPSMSITADGVYDAQSKRIDMQGVISPIYFVNGLFGALFSRRDEGLFGFSYRMRGPVADPQTSVNPLSILTPGRFRDIFRAPPPSQ